MGGSRFAALTELGTLLLCFAWSARATTIHVDIEATGDKNGSSWSDAYTDLQSALSAAHTGDQIWVAAGIYRPTAGLDRAISFQLVDGVELYGGFVGSESSISERDWNGNPTILSAEIGDPGAADNSYHVVVCVSSCVAVLDGFWIRDGAGGGVGSSRDGAGILVDHAELELRHVDVDDCEALGYGGGLVNYGGQVRIESSRFGGEATYGGSIATLDNGTIEFLGSVAAGVASTVGGSFYCRMSALTLRECELGGTAQAAGGAIYAIDGSQILLDRVDVRGASANEGGAILAANCALTLQHTTFQSNSAELGWGGALRTSGGSLVLTNSALRNNSALSGGGGIFVDTTNMEVTNTVFAGNHSPSASLVGGHSIHISDCSPRLLNVSFLQSDAAGPYPEIVNDGGLPLFTNCILWGSKVMVPRNLNGGATRFSHSVVLGSGGSGAAWVAAYGIDLGGNLDLDPLYRGPATHDLRLSPTSAGIDAGYTGAIPPSLVLDLNGNPRIVGPCVDMGAYEWQGGVGTRPMSMGQLRSLFGAPE